MKNNLLLEDYKLKLAIFLVLNHILFIYLMLLQKVKYQILFSISHLYQKKLKLVQLIKIALHNTTDHEHQIHLDFAYKLKNII